MSIKPGPDAQRQKTQLLIWWVLWVAVLNSLVILYFLLGRGPEKQAVAGDVFVNLAGVLPLFVSIVIRWLVLPRYDELKPALPVFVVGLALAESCGILGMFLGGPYRDDLFVLGVLGVTQFVPVFAKRMLEPKGSGFIPNN